MSNYLEGKIDKVFFITCTDNPSRVSLSQYAVNRLFNEHAEIRYTSLCEMNYLNYDALFNKEALDEFKIYDARTNARMVNCLIEQYKCIRQAYNRGFERIMICEDDFRVFPENEEKFKEAVINIPEDGDIIKFVSWSRKDNNQYNLIRNIVNNTFNDRIEEYNDYYYKLVYSDTADFMSTCCDVYNRKGMEIMMKWIESEFLMFDIYFDPVLFSTFKEAINNKELNFYLLKDPIVYPKEGSSIIGYARKGSS